VILLLAIISFVSMSSLRMADAMLPEIARVFSASLAEVAPVISVYAIVYGFSQLAFGALADRFGKLRVIAVFTFATSICALGAALAMSLDQLILARALAGACSAGFIPMSIAWVGDTIPYERRQVTLARLGLGTTVGIATGQLVGGLFADTVGWRWAFVVLTVAFIGSGFLLVREIRQLHRYGVRRAPPPDAGLLERLRAVLSIGRARLTLLVAFGSGAFLFGMLALVPSHMHGNLGVGLSVSGAVAAMYGLGAILYILSAQFLIPRLGQFRLMTIGGTLSAASFLAFLIIDSAWQGMLACLVLGFFFYMAHNTVQTYSTQMAPAARGTAISLFATILFFGQSGGVALGAGLVDSLGGKPLFAAAALGLLAQSWLFAWVVLRKPG